MQSNKQHYRGSTHSQARLKLSTACTECHRRKQKCDQKQPCRNCARRYPQPACVYRTGREATTSSGSSGGNAKDPDIGKDNHLQPPSENSQHDSGTDVSRQFSSGSQQADQEPKREGGTNWDGTLSMASLDRFDSKSYQQLLSSMVSQISASTNDSSDAEHARLKKQGECQSALVHGKKDVKPTLPLLAPASQQPSPSRLLMSSVDPLHFLGVTPTVNSAELLHAFLTVIVKFVVSIDGNPSSNYYNDAWVPWCVKSPLLAHLGIFTASCYQAETQKISPGKSAVVLRYKCKVIELLNEMLAKPENATCTEAVTGVIYLLVNEWYWNNYENVKAHMRGLKEMVRLRGGIGELGSDEEGRSGWLRKMVLLTDYQISCTYNSELSFPHAVKIPENYPTLMRTPFVFSQTAFLSIADKLKVSKETAALLDDMQFLFKTFFRTLSSDASSDEREKLSSTAFWMQNRISSLNVSTNDAIFSSILVACRIYLLSITSHTLLHKCCTLVHLQTLWANMWQIKLSRWKEIPGIFLFIILAAMPAAQETPYARFLKNMLKTTASYISLENWNIVDSTLMGFVRLQRWLRDGEVGEMSGGKIVQPLEFVQIYAG